MGAGKQVMCACQGSRFWMSMSWKSRWGCFRAWLHYDGVAFNKAVLTFPVWTLRECKNRPFLTAEHFNCLLLTENYEISRHYPINASIRPSIQSDCSLRLCHCPHLLFFYSFCVTLNGSAPVCEFTSRHKRAVEVWHCLHSAVFFLHCCDTWKALNKIAVFHIMQPWQIFKSAWFEWEGTILCYKTPRLGLKILGLERAVS